MFSNLLKIAIEADGETFHASDKQQSHDKERDAKLRQQGWTVLRFTDEQISGQIEKVMQTVVKTIMEKERLLKNQSANF